MADSGWVVVAGAVVGGSLTGAIALFQARSQQRFEVSKLQEDHKWSEQVTAKERDHAEIIKRREELIQIYTRYQLAVDRFENAVRDLAEFRRSGTLDNAIERTGAVSTQDESLGVEHSQQELIRDLRDPKIQAYEAAQNEYDGACQLLQLLAPSKTAQAVSQQRKLFNGLAIQALHGTYDHEANFPEIVEAAGTVLKAMRSDLGSPG